MQTLPVAEPNVKAFRALLYERPGVLGKLADGRIYFFDDDGSVVDFEPEMAVFTTVLGQAALADTARLLDALHGGAAAIACTRQMEVQ
jgi:hypothetical protein